MAGRGTSSPFTAPPPGGEPRAPQALPRRAWLRLAGAAALLPALPLPLRGQPNPAGLVPPGLVPPNLAPAATAPASLAADNVTLLLPGPEGGAAALWARGVMAGLARGLPHAVALRATILGGPDGVTAANRFATLEAGDGRTLLVLPGLAAHARLVGESRAQFQPESWLPLCVSWQGAVLAGHAPSAPSTRPLRLALPGPDAPEAAALLALDLLGQPALPVFGIAAADAPSALAQGAADAVVIAAPAAAAQARRHGLTPWLELDTPGRRENPELPAASALPALRPAALAAAQAGFAALRLRAALMLPALTSADVVAAWRRAALLWQEDEARQPAETTAPALVGAEARATIAPLCPAPDAVLAYREWLLRRLRWQAG